MSDTLTAVAPMTPREEQMVLDRLRHLPREKRAEVLDFADSIARQEREREWLAFDAWARKLAKEGGFDHLTEEDVAEIVRASRRAGR